MISVTFWGALARRVVGGYYGEIFFADFTCISIGGGILVEYLPHADHSKCGSVLRKLQDCTV